MSTAEQPPKPLVWLHGQIKTPPFSAAARLEAGTLLRQLQEGELIGMPHSRPMPSIGPRCHELRVRDEDQNWRIIWRITVDGKKRASLETAGWKVGDAAEFLGLTAEERQIVEFRLMVGRSVRRLRERRGLSQHQLASKIGSSQSRVAKIEAASPEVSLDLMLRGFFSAGGRLIDLIASPRTVSLPVRSRSRPTKAGEASS